MHTPLPPDLDDRLRREFLAQIARRGLTREGLAEKVGMSAPKMYRRLSGDTTFTFTEALTVAHALGMDGETLIRSTTETAA